MILQARELLLRDSDSDSDDGPATDGEEGSYEGGNSPGRAPIAGSGPRNGQSGPQGMASAAAARQRTLSGVGPGYALSEANGAGGAELAPSSSTDCLHPGERWLQAERRRAQSRGRGLAQVQAAVRGLTVMASEQRARETQLCREMQRHIGHYGPEAGAGAQGTASTADAPGVGSGAAVSPETTSSPSSQSDQAWVSAAASVMDGHMRAMEAKLLSRVDSSLQAHTTRLWRLECHVLEASRAVRAVRRRRVRSSGRASRKPSSPSPTSDPLQRILEDANGRPPLRSRHGRGGIAAVHHDAASGSSGGSSGGGTPPAGPPRPAPQDGGTAVEHTRRSAADRHTLQRRLKERDATVAAQTQELAELREALRAARAEARRGSRHGGAGRGSAGGGSRPVTSWGSAGRSRIATAGGCTVSVRDAKAPVKPERRSSGPPDSATRRQVAALRSQVLGIQAKLTEVLDTDSEPGGGAESGGRA